MNILPLTIIFIGVWQVLLALFFFAVGHVPQRTKVTMALETVSWLLLVIAAVILLSGGKQ